MDGVLYNLHTFIIQTNLQIQTLKCTDLSPEGDILFETGSTKMKLALR